MCIPAAIRTKKTNSRLSYLDLEINIRDRKFTTAVFDKRDGFSFHIVKFPHMDSNIPSRPGPAYGVYVSQLLRLGRNVIPTTVFYQIPPTNM